MGKFTDTLIDPRVKDILLVIGVSGVVAASILLPALPMALKPIIDLQKQKRKDEREKEWNRFNQSRLKQSLKRLNQQKIIEIKEKNNDIYLKLTDKGKTKLLKYQLEEMMVERPPRWDSKWRLIIYDIKKEKRGVSEIFRKMLCKMEFLKLQRSVYLTPYPCDQQMEFLRQFYGLGEEVIYVVAQKIENEEVYKKYFGL